MVRNVTAAYAKAHLPELLKQAEKGKTIASSRYKKLVAVIAPVPKTDSPRPKFGTGKGRARLIDPHAFDPMTDEEVEALIEGRY